MTNLKTLEPIWKDNYITLVTGCSNEYAPYLSVCLQSLVQNAQDKNNYDIIVLESKISEKNKEILKKQIEKTNIKLRFFNPTHLISNYNLKCGSNWSIETYFKLVVPDVLKNFDKIIYTDVDIIFQKDIENLFKTNVQYGIAAAIEINYIPQYYKYDEIKKHLHEEINLDTPYQYHNAGVLVMDLKYFRENDLTRKLLEIASKKIYKFLEQDILNMYFKNKITKLDEKWNSLAPIFIQGNDCKVVKQEVLDKYYSGRKQAAIIHYIGTKPWENKKIDRAEIWWKYAKKSPFKIEYKKTEKNKKLHKILLLLKQVI